METNRGQRVLIKIRLPGNPGGNPGPGTGNRPGGQARNRSSRTCAGYKRLALTYQLRPGYNRLPQATTGYNNLPQATTGYNRLPQATTGYHRLPPGYHQ